MRGKIHVSKKHTSNRTLSEEDFYQQTDDRIWESYIEDVYGGDNFADYCKDFFNLLEEEDYFEN